MKANSLNSIPSLLRSAAAARAAGLAALLIGASTATLSAATFSDDNWISMNPSIPGADGPVHAAVVDGSGHLYIGGQFTVVGGVVANHIAKWDGRIGRPSARG